MNTDFSSDVLANEEGASSEGEWDGVTSWFHSLMSLTRIQYHREGFKQWRVSSLGDWRSSQEELTNEIGNYIIVCKNIWMCARKAFHPIWFPISSYSHADDEQSDAKPSQIPWKMYRIIYQWRRSWEFGAGVQCQLMCGARRISQT